MFGLRSDGTKVKIKDPIVRLFPHIMNKRTGSQNFMIENIDCCNLDEFIQNERELGNSYNYMHIVIACIARVFYEKPQLNRFIVNGLMYDRKAKDKKNIVISLTVKKHLSEGSPETVIKFSFNGTETIEEIKNNIDDLIKQTTTSKEEAMREANKTEKAAKKFGLLPNFLVRFLISLAKWADRHGLLPKKIISLSPFHCSCFLTNLKSLRTGSVLHHLYEFGTTSMFISMGKEEEIPGIVDIDTIAPSKVMQMGFTIDERVADGFYFTKALKLIKKYLNNPALLKERPEEIK